MLISYEMKYWPKHSDTGIPSSQHNRCRLAAPCRVSCTNQAISSFDCNRKL